MRLDSGVCAFDCLEFDANLRWLDPQSDVAFLFMDCLVRERADLGYGFLDGYLDASGDYDGVCLLPFYTAYRAMVRAKVAALRSAQGGSDEARELLARSRRLLGFGTGWMTRPPGRLVLTCGLSGSGKSHVAKRLLTRLPAVRLRSDVARKARAGVAPGESAAADVDQGLYAASRVRDTYDHLRDVAEDLLRSGERVIVDATFIEARLRTSFLEMADGVGAAAVILYCHAPEAVLLERVTARNAAGRDPSDATPAVLAAQRQRFEVPQERVVAFDTDTTLDDPSLERLVARLLA